MLKSRKARKGHAQASYDGMKRRGDLPAFLEEYKGNYDWETFKERYKLRMTHDRFRLLIRKDEDQDVKEAHRQRNDKWRRAGHYPDPQSVHTQSATDGETGTSSKESAHRQAKTASRAKSASGAPSASDATSANTRDEGDITLAAMPDGATTQATGFAPSTTWGDSSQSWGSSTLQGNSQVGPERESCATDCRCFRCVCGVPKFPLRMVIPVENGTVLSSLSNE